MEPSEALAPTLAGACIKLVDTDSASALLQAACAMPHGVGEASRAGAAPPGVVSTQWQLSIRPPTPDEVDQAAAATGSGRSAVQTQGQAWGIAIGVVVGCLLLLVAALLAARYALRRARGGAYVGGSEASEASDSVPSAPSSAPGRQAPRAPASFSGTESSSAHQSHRTSGTDEAAPRLSTIDPETLQIGGSGDGSASGGMDGSASDADSSGSSRSGTTGSESEG